MLVRITHYFKYFILMAICVGTIIPFTATQAATTIGRDLIPVFFRALQGSPLRVVAIGGSITQAGNGWIGAWLRDQFPKSTVVVQNSGMSATGSGLGIFRLDRDVIAFQPDLVLIEFAVNDSSGPDVNVIRNLENMIIRLKKLPHPPAIVFVETASRRGGHIARHQRVSAYYHFLDINLHQAVTDELAQTHQPWNALFADDVHPNDVGHAFYGKVISTHLQPYVEEARALQQASEHAQQQALRAALSPLPKPLSTVPLLLDARLVTLWPQAGWKLDQPLAFWWNRFFQTVITPTKPGVYMTIPFRGTTAGLFYALHESYGSFYASVDGNPPIEIQCNPRRGYEYTIIADGLPACEHTLTLVYPQQAPGPVELGYLLIAGENKANDTLAPCGPYTAEALLTWHTQTVPASAWCWAGPFGDIANEPTERPSKALSVAYPAEQALKGFSKEPMTYQGHIISWQCVDGDDSLVNLAKLTGFADRGINYAVTRVWSEKAETRTCRFTLDYFGTLWVNGKVVKEFTTSHGSGLSPQILPLPLHAGWNEVMVKLESGSVGNSFSLSFVGADLNDLRFANPLTEREEGR